MGVFKRISFVSLVELFLLLGLVLTVGQAVTATAQSPGSVDDFEITSFSADYYLTRSPEGTSILTVNEILVAKFPEFDQNHGILRAIPDEYQSHTVSLKIQSVTNERDVAYRYTTTTTNHNLVLKIGDAGTYVHGPQTYKIRYEMRNVINFQAGQDEFYWDINGDQWLQTFKQVIANIHIPKELDSALLPQRQCYAGVLGGIASNCTVAARDDELETVITVLANSPLQPRQTLTAILAFKAGTFAIGPEVAREQFYRKIKVALAAIAVTLPPLIAAKVMHSRWRRFGNDPKSRGIIVPEYAPPKDFNVLISDFVLNQKMSQKAFSAAIIELAVGRYFNIYETKQKKTLRRDVTDYELELIKDPSGITPELKKVAHVVFGTGQVGTRIKLSELKILHASIYKNMREMENLMSQNLTTKGYFKKDPKKVKTSYMAWAGGIFFVSMAGLFIWPVSVLAVGLALAALVMFGFAFIMPARTEAGVKAHDDLLGLRSYIKMAETDRLKYLQSPKGAERVSDSSEFDPKTPAQKIKLFEKLLPYAMLFNLEKDWTKQFQDLYKQQPDWYFGGWTTFNSVYLASSISGFGTYNSAVFAPPSSSSGSGFSGGGSSGGGGGGGGGGGW